MNTQQLECFIQVAENLNFARAARNLHITQPAVSRQIHALESELGARLFDRTTRTVSLTPIGNSFLADAGDILNRMKYAAVKVQHNYRESVPIMSIGCYDAVDLTVLPILFGKLREIVPDIRPDVHIVPHKYILDRLMEGNLDMMLGFEEGMPVCGGIGYRELVQLKCCCVVPMDHRFARKKEITEEELLKETIVICDSLAVPERVSKVQNQLRPFFAPPSVCYCDRVQIAIALVKSGFGFAVLPELKGNPDPVMASIPIAGTESSSYGLLYRLPAENAVFRKFLAAL